jgi:hypothetical protein
MALKRLLGRLAFRVHDTAADGHPVDGARLNALQIAQVVAVQDRGLASPMHKKIWARHR